MVGGTERGNRYATQQINFAYAALLSSHFQGYCRDLHSECIDHLVSLVPNALQKYLRLEWIWNRSLSRGNPHPGAIGQDFGRLGFDFWTKVYSLDARNERRREILNELLGWRNAIAHQDFDLVAPSGIPSLHLAKVREWRRALNRLSHEFDTVVYDSLSTMLGTAPW